MTNEQIIKITELSLDGVKVYPCHEYGPNVYCTRVLTDRVFYNRFETVYMNVCTYHINKLDKYVWKEVI